MIFSGVLKRFQISSIHHEFLFKEKGRFETLLKKSQKKKAVPNRRRGKVKCKWAGEESSKKDKLIEELKLLICKYEKARIGYLDDQKNCQAILTGLIDNKGDFLLFRMEEDEMK